MCRIKTIIKIGFCNDSCLFELQIYNAPHGNGLYLLQLNKLSNLRWQTDSMTNIFKDLLEHSL